MPPLLPHPLDRQGWSGVDSWGDACPSCSGAPCRMVCRLCIVQARAGVPDSNRVQQCRQQTAQCAENRQRASSIDGRGTTLVCSLHPVASDMGPSSAALVPGTSLLPKSPSCGHRKPREARVVVGLCARSTAKGPENGPGQASPATDKHIPHARQHLSIPGLAVACCSVGLAELVNDPCLLEQYIIACPHISIPVADRLA